MELKIRSIVALTTLSLCLAPLSFAQTVQFDKVFVCNGEHQIVSTCRDDSNSSNCMVAYPDRPLQGGMQVQKAELRGDVVNRIKSCLGPNAKLASTSTIPGETAPAPTSTVRGETALPPRYTKPSGGFLGYPSFDAFMEQWFGWMLFLVLSLCGLWFFGFFRKKRTNPTANPAWLTSNKEAIEAFGPNVQARSAMIDSVFDRRQDNILFNYEEHFIKLRLGRSLAGMPMREIEALRTAYHLFNFGMQDYNNFLSIRYGIVWADGKAAQYKNQVSLVNWQGWSNIDQAVNLALQDLNGALQRYPDHPALMKLQARFTGGGGDLLPTAPLKSSDSGVNGGGLILGLDSKAPKKVWYYDGEGSLITVAPTRSGKTEGQVYPNVLNWRGPMVILDIKGEIYAKTSKWRKENVGPVHRFSPLDAMRTDCYNPLTAVRSDPLYLWSDAGALADLMIVPSDGSGGGNSKFFEDAARDVVHAAIAYVCCEPDPSKRPMSKLLDIIHGIDWNDFVSYLQARVDMPSLARAGKALAQPLPQETRATILRTAQGHMSAWMGDLIERATAKSSWQPSDFRTGANPTLYICINFGDMESMRSVLRTIIGQHINLLTSGEPPARSNPPSSPILFLLDEMPQLKNMPPISNALVVGAGYGVKLWMFVQDVGQLKKEYPNAEGMIGNCAVTMYMNPSLADGTAQKLSEDIGFRESIVDGQRVKIVEPNVLAGEQFKDKVIVWARGMGRPASLQKNFAYLDSTLQSRMGSV
jgi:type IV secretion system protein VirD4